MAIKGKCSGTVIRRRAIINSVKIIRRYGYVLRQQDWVGMNFLTLLDVRLEMTILLTTLEICFERLSFLTFTFNLRSIRKFIPPLWYKGRGAGLNKMRYIL